MRFIEGNGKLIIAKSSQKGMPLSLIKNLPEIRTNLTYKYSANIQQFLEGKELLMDEIPFSFPIIKEHFENDYIQFNYGVENVNKKRCNRCANEDLFMFSSFLCARCGEMCFYCRKCIMMGRVSECTPLISWKGPRLERSEPAGHRLTWDGKLSRGQMDASKKIVETIQSNNEILIWAVCGAGKTEVLFEGLQMALYKNQRICIATPRTDVVLELAPRLQAAFPETKIAALYGGSKQKNEQAEMYIATTHQLLRFKEAFDVVIVDEVDAFPFSVDKSLQFAVEKSRKKTSSLIYLTATPSKQWKREVRQNKRQAIKIPARYHGHALPVPNFEWCGNWTKEVAKGRLPKNVAVWLQKQLKLNKQAFLFVPNILLLEKIERICKFYNDRIESVHANDRMRKEKVRKFRQGEIPIIITSTILERGVTIPNSDVAVLGAEDDIFTESALVQISGRVGRHINYPTGNIIFFHYGKTDAMVEAKKHIEEMNKEAREKGYLK
ncbi:DEAD/DEAH box helicase [Metabacillus fastidiosus]|uniref:DEAD/DEAH box helicase n=2 Tax=Metabacillus fastidiosus TaxID=1458 RepID=A0ABU6P052_9BACI|nr:DEAD/DEAH box helicase [Metabacillus fastidiosus]